MSDIEHQVVYFEMSHSLFHNFATKAHLPYNQYAANREVRLSVMVMVTVTVRVRIRAGR